MQPFVQRLAGMAVGVVLGCSTGARPAASVGSGVPDRLKLAAPMPAAVATERAAVPGAPAPPPAGPPLPDLAPRYEPGVFVNLDVSADAELAVAHGRPGARRAIVYLHGACGDPRAPRAWSSAAAEIGTLIALRGDRSCGKNGRFYWGPDTQQLEARVRTAIARVAEVRGEDFDAGDVVLIGYSQGATRAQELHALHPPRYPRLILAGIPVAPSARHLAGAHAVLVLGGELELTTHMRVGVWALEAHRIPVSFALFPKAAHGDFGPDAERVMGDGFAWLLAQP